MTGWACDTRVRGSHKSQVSIIAYTIRMEVDVKKQKQKIANL